MYEFGFWILDDENDEVKIEVTTTAHVVVCPTHVKQQFATTSHTATAYRHHNNTTQTPQANTNTTNTTKQTTNQTTTNKPTQPHLKHTKSNYKTYPPSF
jgi:hypothetical protein